MTHAKSRNKNVKFEVEGRTWLMEQENLKIVLDTIKHLKDNSTK